MTSKFISIRATLLAAVLLGGSLAVGVAQATPQNFSFTGSFNQDDNVQLFHFTADGSSNVVLRTWSYAGGVNAAGQTIAEGGFDPILALFDSTGALVGQNDDGGCSLVAADSASGNCWDTYFSATLSAGNYTVSVMEYDNFANGPNLSNGFTRDGQGNFTSTFGCGTPAFCDVSGHARDNQWAFDILGVDQASTPPVGVPEPGSLGMLALGLLAMGWLIRRRRLA